MSVDDVLRVEQPAELVGEDQPLILVEVAELQPPLSLAHPVLLEGAEDALANWDNAAAASLVEAISLRLPTQGSGTQEVCAAA